MWYLLVAAGAGYLATKWQSGQKARSRSSQNGEVSCPSAQPNGSKRESLSSQPHSIAASPKLVSNESSLDFGSQGQNSCVNGFHSSFEKDTTWTSSEIMVTRRTACKGGFLGITDGIPDMLQLESKDSLASASKYRTIDTDNVYNEEKLLENDKDSEDKLQEDGISPSPSSCCSCSSTVINSPVDSFPVLQRGSSSVQVQGKESGSQSTWQNGLFHLQEMGEKNQVKELPNETLKLSRNDSPRKESPQATPVKRQSNHVDSNLCKENLLDDVVELMESKSTAPASNDVHSDRRMTLDTGINVSLRLTGKRQRDDSRLDDLPDKHSCTPPSRFDAKKGMCESTVRKSGSTAFDAASKRTVDNMDDVNSDTFVSFGLAMAAGFMVSSSKREVEKMGNVLRETEDLVNDMRKELEERKLHSSMDEDNNDGIFTIKPEDAIYQQQCTAEVVANHLDAFSTSGIQFHENDCLKSDVIEDGAKTYDIGGRTEVDSEITGLECKRRGRKAERLGVNCNWESDFYDFKEESDPEGCDNDFTMSMIELERKLWQVFHERQEERILELEAALEVALSELHAKEEELHWWKNHASWLRTQSSGLASEKVPLRNPLHYVKAFDFMNKEGIRTESQQLLPNKANMPVLEAVEVSDSSLNSTGLSNKNLVRAEYACSSPAYPGD